MDGETVPEETQRRSPLSRQGLSLVAPRFRRHLAVSPARLAARMDSLLSFPLGLFIPYNMPVYPRALRFADHPPSMWPAPWVAPMIKGLGFLTMNYAIFRAVRLSPSLVQGPV